MKRCPKCRIEKGLSEFYKSGLYSSSYCKKCHIEYGTLYALNKREKRKELYKKYKINQPHYKAERIIMMYEYYCSKSKYPNGAVIKIRNGNQYWFTSNGNIYKYTLKQ